MTKYLAIIGISVVLSGCSGKQLYQAGEDFRRSDCVNKAMSEPQLSECEKQQHKTYEEYEKEREAVINQ